MIYGVSAGTGGLMGIFVNEVFAIHPEITLIGLLVLAVFAWKKLFSKIKSPNFTKQDRYGWIFIVFTLSLLFIVFLIKYI